MASRRAVQPPTPYSSSVLGSFLLLDHGVKDSDGVGLKPAHRAAAVKNEYNLRYILFHVHYLRI